MFWWVVKLEVPPTNWVWISLGRCLFHVFMPRPHDGSPLKSQREKPWRLASSSFCLTGNEVSHMSLSGLVMVEWPGIVLTEIPSKRACLRGCEGRSSRIPSKRAWTTVMSFLSFRSLVWRDVHLHGCRCIPHGGRRAGNEREKRRFWFQSSSYHFLCWNFACSSKPICRDSLIPGPNETYI